MKIPQNLSQQNKRLKMTLLEGYKRQTLFFFYCDGFPN